MPSGGARARSGPPADPNALRRERKDDKAWVSLPSEGRKGRAPALPLPGANRLERELWSELWKKPQAIQWEALGLQRQVAAYTRAYIASIDIDATAGIKTAVLRMEAELGLSIVGMNSLRWKIVADELGERRQAKTAASAPTGTRAPGNVRDRLQAIADGA
ncbi:hypothetical protein [Microcella sp.]|uniref:hypothetical protein n=1 Tax=Microcella sp. TaxID=1913979 RepID=UPI00391CF574